MVTNISDRIRREFEKETAKKHDENGFNPEYVRKPTWDYVCWLEDKLDKFISKKQEEFNFDICGTLVKDGSFFWIDLDKQE